MSEQSMRVGRLAHHGARILLGAVFAHLGLVKALDPVGFLKLVRQFDLIPTPFLLNFTAAVLPWLEVLCGTLLVIGFRIRAAALLVAILLGGFTAAVAIHAWSLYRVGHLPFCAIHFDCGCGTGEVVICGKLAQNFALGVLSWFVFSRTANRSKFPSTPAT
jgi:uncharacterized membrane protein YphA (DoxX/SURF4 family)